VAAEHVGDQIRRLRKLRGLTQHQLASGTHFSVSLIKKVERGAVPASPALVAETARALKVKPAHLYGTEPDTIADQPQADAAGLAALRTALDDYDDPRPEGQPLTVPHAIRRVERISAHVYRLRYDDAVAELPNLLEHLYILADGTAGEPARAALHDAYRLAASVAAQYRQADLAAICSERHVHLAPLTGDPLRVAISAYHRSTRLLQSGDYSVGLRLLDRSHQQVDDTPAGQAVAIQLHLRSAVLAARAGDRARADDYTTAARDIVETSSPPARPYYNIDASRLNVDVHWCAVPVEDYDGTASVARAAQVRIADPRRPERVGHHWVDMARAWLLHGDRNQALDCLNRARWVAPNRIRHHPTVRSTVIALAQNDRRVTESLASFARWAAIEV
jgi:transcriptional regulator with XRE-family HTH domain